MLGKRYSLAESEIMVHKNGNSDTSGGILSLNSSLVVCSYQYHKEICGNDTNEKKNILFVNAACAYLKVLVLRGKMYFLLLSSIIYSAK